MTKQRSGFYWGVGMTLLIGALLVMLYFAARFLADIHEATVTVKEGQSILLIIKQGESIGSLTVKSGDTIEMSPAGE